MLKPRFESDSLIQLATPYCPSLLLTHFQMTFIHLPIKKCISVGMNDRSSLLSSLIVEAVIDEDQQEQEGHVRQGLVRAEHHVLLFVASWRCSRCCHWTVAECQDVPHARSKAENEAAPTQITKYKRWSFSLKRIEKNLQTVRRWLCPSLDSPR